MSSHGSLNAFSHRHPSSLVRGLLRRILASAALLVGGLVFVLLYLAFWASEFTWYQNVAIVVSVALVVPTVTIGMWIAWGLGIARRGLFEDD